MTRREFIASLAAVALAPRNLFAAAPADFDESLAVFLSDVHVNGLETRDGKPIPGAMRDRLSESVAEILRMNPLPRYVFIFGDLAHLEGRIEDYRRSYPDLKLLVDAGIKLAIGMGNHDHRKAFLEVWPEYAARTLVPGLIVTATSLPGYDLVMLDSLDELDKPNAWNPVGGKLSAPLQEWILAELPKWPRPFIIGAHHPLWELKFSGGKVKNLETAIGTFPNCRGFVHGHDHLWSTNIVNWRNAHTVPRLTLPSNGFWGDNGYVVMRPVSAGGRKAVRAELCLKDFVLERSKTFPSRPPMWDARMADLKGAKCTFVL